MSSQDDKKEGPSIIEAAAAAVKGEKGKDAEYDPNEKTQGPPSLNIDPELKKQALKGGDYVVQVHVIEARNLKGRGLGDMSDPVCVVNVMDKKQSTKIHKAAVNVVFDEVLVFEFKGLEAAQVEAGRVTISIFDANTFRRNELIGLYEFDMGTVYYQKNHEFFRQWVALSDITDEHEGVQGFLRASVVVLGPDDEQYIHTADEEDDEDSSMLSVLMPPKLEHKGKLLRVQVFEVDGLPQMDQGFFGGKCDPYAMVQFAGISAKTKHKSGTSTEILQEIQIPVMEPVMSGKVLFSIYDWDAAGTDDRIKTSMFNYRQIKEKGFSTRWVNLYGAPIGKQRGKIARKMNRGYMDGTCFRGRVLMNMTIEDKPEPKKEVIECSGAFDARPKDERYTLRMDLYEGSEIADKGELQVELSCGSFSWRSGAAKSVDGRAKWYQEMKDGTGEWPAFSYPQDLDQVPNVFIYLCQKEKRIAFLSFPFRDLVERGWIVPPSWNVLKEDPCHDAFDADKLEFPGSMLFSLRAGRWNDAPSQVHPNCRPLLRMGYEDIAEEKAEEEAAATSQADATSPLITPAVPAAPKAVSTVGTLTVDVLNAKDLPAVDRFSKSSDPFIKLRLAETDQKFQTKVIKKNVNPEWNESFVFQNVPIRSTLEVKVYDHDITANDLLGTFEVDMRNQQSLSKVPFGRDFVQETPFLVNAKDQKATVRLRFSFKYLPVEQSQVVEENINKENLKKEKSVLKIFKKDKKSRSSNILGEFEMRQYQLRFHLYVGRGLPASDKTGLADPYVIVRVAGKMIKSDKKVATLNPQWYKTYTVNLDLPTPLSMAPHIQAQIYDWDEVSKDDPIGRFEVSMLQALTMNTGFRADQLQPQWFQLKNWDDKPLEGSKVLASFQLLEAHEAAVYPVPNIVPATTPMFVELTTLGLRNLQSVLGVHKTFIDFELPSGKRFQTNKSNVPTAKNPNFLQLMRIPIDLPVHKMFAPCIDIEVRDALFGGLVKRLLGTATVDLSQFMISIYDVDEQGNKYDTGRWRSSTHLDVLDERKLEFEIREEEERFKQEEEEKERKRVEEKEAKLKAETDKKLQVIVAKQRAEDEKASSAASVPASAPPALPPVRSSISAPNSAPNDAGLGLGDLAPKSSPSSALTQPLLPGEVDMGMGLGDLPASPRDTRAPSSGNRKLALKKKPSVDGYGLLEDEKAQPDTPGMREEKSDEKKPLLQERKDYAIDITDFPQEDEKGNALSLDSVATQANDNEPEELPEYLKGRKLVDNELEDEMHVKPFHEIKIFTGQKNASVVGSAFSEVGSFKGLIHLSADKEPQSDVDMKELLQPKSLFLRLYILRGIKLMPMDRNGKSDPYLIIKLGKHKISTRERHLKKTIDPEFYESFEIPCTLPGDSNLEISVMDWDGINDDLIGKTIIDIEDRWFSKNWRKINLKPLERRTLRNPTSSASQGKLEMWMELVTPTDAKRLPMVDIKPPPPQPFELRVIVWGCRDVTIKDTITEQNDLYITGHVSVPGLKRQQTDTHLRSKKGKGNFNWRMKWTLNLPVKPWPRLRFQIWDKDFFSANDFICESVLSLKGLCKQAMKKKDRVKLLVKGKDRFWIEDMRSPNDPDKSQGRMEISIELMPLEIASQLPAGFGRSDPNQNPFLPPPEGRVQWDIFSPLKMLKELLGENLYRKICCAFFLLIFISAFSFTAPMIFSNLVSNAILPK